jgi:hypothetical protein
MELKNVVRSVSLFFILGVNEKEYEEKCTSVEGVT